MRIAVIGAGPAGLSAAYILTKNKIKVDVFEATHEPGGMSGSIRLWNQMVDYGPHRYFSPDKRVNEFWMEVVGNDFCMVNRLTRIFYKNRFFKYPIQLFDALYNLGLIEALRCLFSYLKEVVHPISLDGSFETWVQSRFGRRLYEIFFKTYSEKLWGMPCTSLDSDFASQRIKKLSFLEALINATGDKQTKKHSTLLDRFAYPFNGSGSVYRKMAMYIEENGGTMYYDTPVKKVLMEKGQIIGVELTKGRVATYDHVISSMPLTIMVSRLDEAPDSIKQLCSQLTYRNTLLIYLLINTTETFPDNWIYVHSKELKTGRITNFRNWCPTLFKNEQKTILALEFWCNSDESFWHMEESKLIEMASHEISSTGLVDSRRIEDGFVLRLEKSYPVYQKGYKEILGPIEQYIKSIQGLSVIGRNGAFKYNNQDHSILMGLLAADSIISGKQCDLSKVNADYTSYQESFLHAEIGLCNQKG